MQKVTAHTRLTEEVTIAKRYDVIVVGGGPAGLMAAKTAAEDGLKVVLIERKKNITDINRACLQLFYHPQTFQR